MAHFTNTVLLCQYLTVLPISQCIYIYMHMPIKMDAGRRRLIIYLDLYFENGWPFSCHLYVRTMLHTSHTQYTYVCIYTMYMSHTHVCMYVYIIKCICHTPYIRMYVCTYMMYCICHTPYIYIHIYVRIYSL